jgi:molybdate transport system substrate-binding protein
VEDLGAAGVRVIAMARPELAPYGEAAVETLQSLGIWERVKARVVYGSSVAMARQYGATGNADAVFVPYALVLKEKGTVVTVDPQRHKPIEQALGVVARSGRKDAAIRFADFLTKGPGRAILRANGYQ